MIVTQTLIFHLKSAAKEILSELNNNVFVEKDENDCFKTWTKIKLTKIITNKKNLKNCTVMLF
jgi:hypothetical protein